VAAGPTPTMAEQVRTASKAKLIGIMMPRDGLFGPVSLGVAITDAARAVGYATTNVAVPQDPDMMTEVIRELHRLRVEGLVIVHSTTGVDAMMQALFSDFPVSIISGGELAPGQTGVCIAQRTAAHQVSQHLFDVGCTRVAHVAGPDDWYDAHERVTGWKEVVAGREGCALLRADSWGSEAAYVVTKSLFSGESRPDGIFAANDLIALGVLRAAKEAGLDPPRQVAVAGFDNIAGSAYFQPALTSVEQPFAEAGRSSVDMLLSAIRGDSGGVVTYTPRIVTRASTSEFKGRPS